MGYVKALMMEEQARGFGAPADKYVCKDCFDDYAIRAFVDSNAEYLKCNYCSASSDDEPIAAPLGSVIGFIMDGILREWQHPIDGVSYSTRDGGWLGATVIFSSDLFFDLAIEKNGGELLHDIISTFHDCEWCIRDPYNDREEDKLYYGWERLVEQVKYKARYVFYRAPKEDVDEAFEEDHPHIILDQLGVIVNDLGLIKSISVGSEFVRARMHKKDETLTTVAELGPPSRDDATTPNRMSPVGIPAFYGSEDPLTAAREVYDSTLSDRIVTTITFTTLKNFKVLDLTSLPEMPSLFDEARWELRASIKFLDSFLTDLSIQVKKDKMAHIEYVPTQIVSEYFKLIFRDKESGDKIMGILYPSACPDGKNSCVLFIQNEQCSQDDVDMTSQKEMYLEMLSSTRTTKCVEYYL